MSNSKIYLTSKGCFIVQTETNHIAGYLKNNGYELVETVEEADAVIITTCAVTETAAEGTYRGIFECLEKRKENIPVYIVGCFTRIETQRMEELLKYGNIIPVPEIRGIENEFLGANPWDSVVYNNFYSHPFSIKYLQTTNDEASLRIKLSKKLFGFIDLAFKKETLFHFLFSTGHLYNPEVQRALWPVIVSKGCTHACSYCVVRKGRGKFTSKPLSSILNEIKVGIDKGYKRMLLIGDELGPYGVDFKDGTSLEMLLNALSSDEFPISIGLWYLDAFLLMRVVPVLKTLAKRGKLFFLGITIQHGSDRILHLMNRRYSIPDTMDAIRDFRKYPGTIIATQFMVGFPSETEEDFLKTVALVESGYFDKVEVFEYSPRPGTRAATMTDDVSSQVKRERAARLKKLAFQKSKKLYLNHVIKQFKR